MNNGAQSHCGRRAFITRKSSSYDVTTQFLLVTRTICTELSAGIFARETCHTWGFRNFRVSLRRFDIISNTRHRCFTGTPWYLKIEITWYLYDNQVVLGVCCTCTLVLWHSVLRLIQYAYEYRRRSRLCRRDVQDGTMYMYDTATAPHTRY